MTSPFPKWARWIAQDEDGDIYVFSNKPIISSHFQNHWTNEKHRISRYKLIAQGTPNPHWRNSLDCLGEDDA